MNVRYKFMSLTSRTYPHGTEHLIERHLPRGARPDGHGNYYTVIGDSPTTMFTCHLDTYTDKATRVRHRSLGNMIMSDGTTILGADDKAGMVVLLYMVEMRVPGVYYFFIGEEKGCVGSRRVAAGMESGEHPFAELKGVTKVVSFDRRGTTSVITEQMLAECCSTDFAAELVARLNSSGQGLSMKMDDKGAGTDSAQFTEVVPECTNISVGYYDEHTVSERQDIDHLERICRAASSIDWETLPIRRDPSETRARHSAGWGLEDWDAPWDSSTAILPPLPRMPDPLPEYTDDFYSYMIDPSDGVRRKVMISRTWIMHETLLIKGALRNMGREIDEIKWDGTTCWLRERGSQVMEYVGSRQDLALYLHRLGDVPPAHLRWERDYLVLRDLPAL